MCPRLLGGYRSTASQSLEGAGEDEREALGTESESVSERCCHTVSEFQRGAGGEGGVCHRIAPSPSQSAIFTKAVSSLPLHNPSLSTACSSICSPCDQAGHHSNGV